MDQWVQKLSVLIILLTAGATLHCSRLGATCWSPAHFTESHVHYTNTWCSSNSSSHHPLPPLQNNRRSDSQWESALSSPSVELLGDNMTLLMYLIGELILVCALYSLIKCIMSCTSLDVIFSLNIHHSYSKAPVYILVQLAGCLIWVGFAVLTYTAYCPDLMAKPKQPFLCDFTMNAQGRIHSYVVQCVDESEAGMKMAVMTNVALCVVVAFSKLVHLVAVFGIQPLLKVDKVAAKMVDRKVIKEANEMSLGFGLSDLYFAILVSGRDITPYITVKQLQEERREKVLYGSRPPSMIC